VVQALNVERGLTFPLSEVASLCGLGEQQLRNWVVQGFVVPVRSGGKGKGRTHRFDLRQLLGLSIAGAFVADGVKMPGELVQVNVETYQRVRWSVIEELLRLRHDEWTDEAIHKHVHDTTPPHGVLTPEEERECLRPYMNLIAIRRRIREAVHARLDMQANRNRAVTPR
jgi:hypothetical protein